MVNDALTVLGIGVAVVFFGLFCLIGIIYLMSFIVRLVRREQRPVHKDHEVVLPEPHAFVPATNSGYMQLTGEQRRQTVAAISAAIAESLGTDVSGIRIHSIKRVGSEGAAEDTDRRRLVAVISAAIAEEMGTEVTGIRIHSIRKVA